MQKQWCRESYPSIDMVSFGNKLKEVCEKQQVSAEDLKDYLHLSSIQAVYLWFNGKRLPNVDNLYAISRYLGIRMDDLVSSDSGERAEYIMRNDLLPNHGKRVMLYCMWLRLDE